jgi:hypothetical protein
MFTIFLHGVMRRRTDKFTFTFFGMSVDMEFRIEDVYIDSNCCIYFIYLCIFICGLFNNAVCSKFYRFRTFLNCYNSVLNTISCLYLCYELSYIHMNYKTIFAFNLHLFISLNIIIVSNIVIIVM